MYFFSFFLKSQVSLSLEAKDEMRPPCETNEVLTGGICCCLCYTDRLYLIEISVRDYDLRTFRQTEFCLIYLFIYFRFGQNRGALNMKRLLKKTKKQAEQDTSLGDFQVIM